MRRPRRPMAAVVAVLATALTGSCGGSSKPVVRTPAVTTPPAVSSAPSPTTTRSAAAAPRVHPVATARPSTGLRDKQRITVTGSGFSPNLQLTVIECAAKGKATTAGDCNLQGIVPVTSDAAGRLSVQLEVLKGPFGTNKVVCSAQQTCLVSVTQASLQPTEEADAAIAFAS